MTRVEQAPTGRKSAVEVLAIKPLDSGNIKALVDVRLFGQITIREVKIIQQPGQSPWVSPPDKEFTGRDGQKKYVKIIEIADALKQEVSQVVINAWMVAQERDEARDGF